MIFDDLVQDIRVGARVLLKEKGFCLLAIAVLALGISGVTTQFSVIDGTILRGLPFPSPEQLVDVQWRDPKLPPGNSQNLLPADYLEAREVQQSFSDMAAYLNGSTVNVTIGTSPQRYQGAYVTDAFFSILGVKPMLGRDFTAEDNKPGAPRVTIIGHGIWLRDFQGDRNVLGTTVRMNGVPATIIGVMPPGFAFPTNEQLWVPLFNEFEPKPRNFQVAPGQGFFAAPNVGILARLKPGVAVDDARVEWNAIAARFATEYPETNQFFTEAQVQSLITTFVGRVLVWILYAMLGAVGVVLVIACVNVMNMQFARATLRAKELAVRGALGATRSRLVRQMLTESLLLAAIGAGVGVLMAYFWLDLIRAAVAAQTTPLPFWIRFEIDPRILAATAGVSVLAAVLSGLLPALVASRANAADALKESGRGNTSRAVNALTRGLVIFEIALTSLLLVLSTLLVRSIINQQHIDYGYDTSSVLVARLGLFPGDYPEAKDRQVFFDRLSRELRASPSIASASLTSRFRMVFGGNGPYEIEGATYATDRDRPQGSFENVSDGYFESLGMEVLEGRDFTPEDSDERQPVAIVNTTFARKHFGRESALGRKVRPYNAASPGPWRTIIGVVPDTHMQGPFNTQLDDSGMFVPLNVIPPMFATIIVRPHGGPAESLTEPLRRAVAAVDPNLPLYFVGTPANSHGEILAQNRILATMFFVFGIVAVALASVGLYGVMSFAVSQRTQEFGIRMALGAGQPRIIGMVLRDCGLQLGIGLGLGLSVALLGATLLPQFFSNVLFGVSRFDPAIYGFVVVLIAVIAVVSSLVPARRATKVDPMIALRAD